MRRLDETRRCQHQVRVYSVRQDGREGAARAWTSCSRAEGSAVQVAGQAERRELLEDLRAMVTYLEANPHLPVGEMATVELTYYPEGCDGNKEAEVLRVADRMGLVPRREGTHFVCEKRIGQALYRVVAIPEAARTRERAYRWGW